MNDDLGIIKYDLKVFKDIFESDEIELNENLIKKANELISNYNCFVSNYDAKSLWEKKKLIAIRKNKNIGNDNGGNGGNRGNNINRNKPRIILIDFSDDMKCKKEFTSFLNKLTDVNKEIIYSKISIFLNGINDIKIKNSLFEVLINFIKISSNNIYIDVLFLFDNEFIKNNIDIYIENFLKNKEWIPKEIIIENKILYDNSNYDKYCLYVKLKKYSLSIIKALLIILNHLNIYNKINEISFQIINDLKEYLNNFNYKHIIELLLEQLIIIFDYHKDNEIIKNLKNIDLNNYEYSTKFKIIKLLEKE